MNSPISAPDERWAMLDIESTGTDEDIDSILEVHSYPVNRRSLQRFPDQAFQRVVCHPSGLPHMDDWALNTHTKSGLLGEISVATAELLAGGMIDTAGTSWVRDHAHLDEMLLAYFQRICAKPGKLILIGNSVHFDKGFLKKHCRKAYNWLHHRNGDVSWTRTMYDAWCGELRRGDVVHRAAADCDMSYSGLVWSKQLMTAGYQVCGDEQAVMPAFAIPVKDI